MTFKSAGLVLSLLAMGGGIAQTPGADGEIRAARRASNEALKNHDLKAFAASLDPELIVVAGRGTFVPSRQAYLDLFAKDFTDPKALRYERLVDSIEVNEDAPLAAEHGHWAGINPNGRRAIGGTYLAMWRRSDAGWKIRSELFVLLTCYDPAACERYRHP